LLQNMTWKESGVKHGYTKLLPSQLTLFWLILANMS
jgi:hypothetical protein